MHFSKVVTIKQIRDHFAAPVVNLSAKADHDNNVVSYRGHQVWQVDFGDKNITQEFTDLWIERDVWRWSSNSMDFALNGSETEYFNDFLNSYNLTYKVLIDDLQEIIDTEKATKTRRSDSFDERGRPTFKTNLNMDEITAYLTRISKNFPRICSLKTIGMAANGRKILMIKISNKKPKNHNILIVGGTHAREWTSIMSAVYVIDRIVHTFRKQPACVRSKNWYIIPVMNPDGFVYSTTTNRLWRKNLRKFSGFCDGVDIDRNFGFQWGAGASSEMFCSEVYSGPTPFSESESMILKEMFESQKFYAYVSIHSYGGRVIIPYAHNGKRTIDGKVQESVAAAMAEAMSTPGTTFRSGTVTEAGVIKAGGLSTDWVYETKGIKHVYIIITRRSLTSSPTGFILNSEELPKAVQDVYNGVIVMTRVARPDEPMGVYDTE